MSAALKPSGAVQALNKADAAPSVPAPHLDPPRPVSHGEALKFNEIHRRSAREAFERVPRYPGPTEKRSLQLMISDLTNNGAEMVECYLNALRGSLPAPPGMVDLKSGECVPVVFVETKDRLAAAKWLGDRLWGKAPETLQLKTDAPKVALNLQSLSLEDLLELDRLLEKSQRDPVTVEADAPTAKTEH